MAKMKSELFDRIEEKGISSILSGEYPLEDDHLYTSENGHYLELDHGHQEEERLDDEGNLDETDDISDEEDISDEDEGIFDEDEISEEGVLKDLGYKSGIQKNKVFSYLETLELRKPLPLLKGNLIYQQVTEARLLDLYPKLAIDLKKVFSNLTFGGTELDNRTLTAFLRLFARKEYDHLEDQLRQINSSDF